MKFGSFDALSSSTFLQLKYFINSQDPHSQTQKAKNQGLKCSNKDNSEEGETSKALVILNFMLRILPDDETEEGMCFLRSSIWFIHGSKIM